MILPIVTIPSPLLRVVSRDVSKQELRQPEVISLIKNMCDTMVARDGIGLAAPQVGVSVNIAVIATDEVPLVIINPKIIKASVELHEDEEGCLSIPGIAGMVPRAARAKVVFLSPQGRRTTVNAHGLFARVLQHEIDHLRGILFVDRVTRFTTSVTPLQRLHFKAFSHATHS
ncbi:MAG: peptide deformylase [Patescibacteria group bacterium]